MSNISIFAKAVTSAGTDLMVQEIDSDVDYAVMTLEICNTTSQDATLKVAVTSASSPGSGDYVEYGATVPRSGGIYTRSQFLMGPGEKLMVNSDSAGLAVRLTGLAQPAST